MVWERAGIRAAGLLALSLIFALSITALAGAAAEFEPNDSRETAAGPLAGGTDYAAGFETNNDVDWYVFYLRAYSQMDFSAANTAGCSYSEPYIRLLDKDGKFVESFYGGEINQVNHLRTTLAAGRYYFEISDSSSSCVGDRYKIRIDPAAAVTASPVCGEAIVAREAVTPELAKVAEQIGYVNGVVAKRTEKVTIARKRLKRLKAHRASRYAKRDARHDLTAAQVSLAKILEKRASFEALNGQLTASLNTANVQITSAC